VTVRGVCRYLGMTRQNYYARRRVRQRRQIDGDLLATLVLRERHEQPRLGTRKLHHRLAAELTEAGVKLGRDRIFEELKARALLVPRKRAAWPQTTQVYQPLPLFHNRICGLEVTQPNQVWVSDLTYLRTLEGYLFLSLITDRMSRKIVGYHVCDSLEAAGCMAALDMALKGLPAGQWPIHHSDRGCQYCSHDYVKQLTAHGLAISMTEQDHCAENALAERMNGILKQEYGLGDELASKQQGRKAAEQAVWLYNNKRPHTALGYDYPELVHNRKV
jgi:putative transposase